MIRTAVSVLAACAFLAAACTAGHPAPAKTPEPTKTPEPAQTAKTAKAPEPAKTTKTAAGTPNTGGTTPVRGAAYTSGGCGHTPLLQGAAPGWAASANPPAIRYALAEHGHAAGFLFGYPLAAADQNDKVLWVVATPRNGQPLLLTGHPLNAAKPVVTSSWPADSFPGEIYPSLTEVPTPGCWQFTLSWNGHTDTVDLWYVRHRGNR